MPVCADTAIALPHPNKLPRWAYSQPLEALDTRRVPRSGTASTCNEAISSLLCFLRVIFRAGPMRLQSRQLPSRSHPPPNPEDGRSGNEGLRGGEFVSGVNAKGLNTTCAATAQRLGTTPIQKHHTHSSHSFRSITLMQRLGTTLATMSTHTSPCWQPVSGL